MADSLDCVGLGLAIARAESEFGLRSSSRNSGVIQAGIYYEKDSLKPEGQAKIRRAGEAWSDAGGTSRCNIDFVEKIIDLDVG